MSPQIPNTAANLHIVHETEEVNTYSDEEIKQAAEALSKKRDGTPTAEKIYGMAHQSKPLMRALEELADVERAKKARMVQNAEADLLAELIFDAGDLADEADAALSVDEETTLPELHSKVESSMKLHVFLDRFMREFTPIGRPGAIYALVAFRGMAIYLMKGWNEWLQDPRTPDERRKVCEDKVTGFGTILNSIQVLLSHLGIDTTSGEGYDQLKRYFDTSDRTRNAILDWAQDAGYGHTFLKPRDFFASERERSQRADDDRSPELQRDPELVSELVVLLIDGGADQKSAALIARSIADPRKRWADGSTTAEKIFQTALFKARQMYKDGADDEEILEATRLHRAAVGITEMNFLAEVQQQSRPSASVMQFQGGEQPSPRRGRTNRQSEKSAQDAALRQAMKGNGAGGGKKGGNAKKRK